MIILLVKFKQPLQPQFPKDINIADNRDAFRRYRGIDILIKTLEIHKDSQAAKALWHALSENSKQT